jgi:hypothetical protein
MEQKNLHCKDNGDEFYIEVMKQRLTLRLILFRFFFNILINNYLFHFILLPFIRRPKYHFSFFYC